MARLYYVAAGSSRWQDRRNWSRRSGGTPCAPRPTAADVVVVDENSGELADLSGMPCRSLRVEGFRGLLVTPEGARLDLRQARVPRWRRILGLGAPRPTVSSGTARALRDARLTWRDAVRLRLATLVVQGVSLAVVPLIGGGVTAYFWVGGTGNTNDAAHYALSSGGAGGAGTPVAGDSVAVDANSGGSAFTITVNAALASASWTINNSNATLLHSAGSTLTGAMTLTSGTLNTNGQTCSWGSLSSSNSNVRTLTLGASAITLTGNSSGWACATVTNLTVTANTAVVTLTGTFTNANSVIQGGGKNWNGLSFVVSGKGWCGCTGTGTTVANLTLNANAADLTVAYGLAMANNWTVTGTLTTIGTQAAKAIVMSNLAGTARTITAAAVSLTDTHFKDITGAGAATWTGTRLGDMFGNTGITMTPATTRYVVASGNYSATATWSASSAGASGASVPLPQDTAVTDGHGSLTLNQQFVANLTCSVSGALTMGVVPAYYNGDSDHLFCGGWTMFAGQTLASVNPATFLGRGTHTIDLKGNNLNMAFFTIGDALGGSTNPGGTYTLASDLKIGTAGGPRNWQILAGTFDAAGFNLTAAVYSFDGGSASRTVKGGSGTWTTVGNPGGGTVWSATTAAYLAAATDFSNTTVVLADTNSPSSSATQTFFGGGRTYGTFRHAKTGTTSKLAISDSNTFGTLDLECTSARTVTLDAGATQTVTVALTTTGTSGNVLSFVSSSPGTTTTIILAAGATETTAFRSLSADVKLRRILPAAAISGSSAAAASITRIRSRPAAATGSSVVAASLVRLRGISPAATGSSTVAASVVRLRGLSPSATGSSSVSAAVSRIRSIEAASTGSSTVSAAVSRARSLAAAATGTSTVVARVTRVRLLAPSVFGSSVVDADVSRVGVVVPADIHGSSTVAAALSRVRHLAPTAAGASIVAAHVTRVRVLEASIFGSSTVAVGFKSKQVPGHGRVSDSPAAFGVTHDVMTGA